MGRIATVLEVAKPECRATLEHETVAVVHRTESGNDVGQHVVPFHGRCRFTVTRRLPSDLHPIGHSPITAANSLTVRGQRTRHRLSHQNAGSSFPGSWSRPDVMGLMGVSAPVLGLNAKASAIEPSRRSGADQLSRRAYSMRMPTCGSGVAAAKASANTLSPPTSRGRCAASSTGAMANSLLDLLRAERWNEDRILAQLLRARTLTTQRQARQG